MPLTEYAQHGIFTGMVSSAAWIALGDPRRRAALELLLDRPRSVNELADQLQLSQPSTSKHLRVLREAGLVTVEHDRQRRLYAIDPQPLAELHEWLARYRRLWDTSLD